MPTTISTAVSAPRSMILVISNRQTPPQSSCWGFFRWWTWREAFQGRLVDLPSGFSETVVDFAGGFLMEGCQRNRDSDQEMIRIRRFVGIVGAITQIHCLQILLKTNGNRLSEKMRATNCCAAGARRSGSRQSPCVNRSRRRRWPARAVGRPGGTPGARGRIVLEGSFVRCSGRGHEPQLRAFLR
jgi:hypothetical protein